MTAAVAGLLTGCHGSTHTPAPVVTTSSSPSPTASPPATAAEQLQRVTGVAARASYRATYVARQSHPATAATWRVWRTPTSLRVDVLTGRVTTTLIVTARASFSCRKANHRRTCFRVAKAGKPIPAPFQLLAQQLFSTSIDTLARHVSTYDVTAAPGGAGNIRVPASSCYAVGPLPSTPRPRVEKAVYCFTASGVLTSVRYPSGNEVRLRAVTMQRPVRTTFVPYSSPTPAPA